MVRWVPDASWSMVTVRETALRGRLILDRVLRCPPFLHRTLDPSSTPYVTQRPRSPVEAMVFARSECGPIRP